MSKVNKIDEIVNQAATTTVNVGNQAADTVNKVVKGVQSVVKNIGNMFGSIFG